MMGWLLWVATVVAAAAVLGLVVALLLQLKRDP